MDAMKWYYRPWAIIVAILLVGPLAIPLVWKSPAIKRGLKPLIIILVILATVWMVMASAEVVRLFLKEARELEGVLAR